MRLRSKLVGIAGCLLLLAGGLQAPPASAVEYDRHTMLVRARFLCDWAPSHLDVSSNPPTFCKSIPEWVLEGYGYEKIETEVMLWWASWIRQDPAAAARNLGKFEDAYAAQQRDLQLEAEGRSPKLLARAKRGQAMARNAAMMSPEDLCSALSYYRIVTFREELERRHVFTDAEWHLIDEERLRVGMSEVAMICSWGKPKRVVRVTDTASDHKKHVYDDERVVHTENGRVTVVQDSEGHTRPFT